VEDLGWKVHAEKTMRIDEERRGEEKRRKRGRKDSEILIFPRRRIARGTLSRSWLADRPTHRADIPLDGALAGAGVVWEAEEEQEEDRH